MKLEDALVTVDSILSLILHRHNIDPPLSHEERRRALVAIEAIRRPDLLAVVRRGVESGTIKGFIEKIRPHYTHDGEWDWECVPVMGCPSDAEFIVIRIPVSDGGEDRP